MATFHFDLVSPEKLAFSGEVDQVDIPGTEGDFGVLSGHAPVVAAMRPGHRHVITGDQAENHRAWAGSPRSRRRGSRVLTEVATSIDELDRAKFFETDHRDGGEALTEKEGDELDRGSSGSIISRASSSELSTTAMH